jgi:hypothetical protein
LPYTFQSLLQDDTANVDQLGHDSLAFSPPSWEAFLFQLSKHFVALQETILNQHGRTADLSAFLEFLSARLERIWPDL